MNRLAWSLLVAVLAACSKESADRSAKAGPAAPRVETAAGASASIPPEAARSAGIEVLSAGPARIRETLTLYGTIRSNAERSQAVRARYPGVVRSVEKRPGDPVARGEVLLTVESNDSLQPYAIRSPIAGRVLERRVNPGETVDGSLTLMTVADLSSVWAEFSVFPHDRGRLKLGQRVRIAGADAGATGEAALDYIAAAGNAAQAIAARAVLDNRVGAWVPGQFVTGEVTVKETPVAVAVAPAALQRIKGRPVVFVQTDGGFETRTVEPGARGANAIEIVKGLAAGERYAARNSFVVKAEALKGEAAEE